MTNWLWESTDSAKNWTNNGWNLLNEGIGGKKEIEFLGPLLDELLILVEFLQLVKGDDFDIQTESLGLILMLLIGDQTDFQVWSWDVWKSDGSDESLIFLWVVILERNLQLNGLSELSFLGLCSHFRDALQKMFLSNL